MDIVAAIALPIVFVILVLWLKQLLYDPNTDGLVLGVGLLALAGIVFLAWPLFELSFAFYGISYRRRSPHEAAGSPDRHVPGGLPAFVPSNSPLMS